MAAIAEGESETRITVARSSGASGTVKGIATKGSSLLSDFLFRGTRTEGNERRVSTVAAEL